MVSVVIPTKDEEKIFTAIERTSLQSPEEIIVVNDSESSDKYKEKLKQKEEIRYIEVEGGGPARARNKGAEEASSEKIIFLDADCYPAEGWLEKMSEALEENEIVEGEVEYIGERCRFSRIVENRGEKGRFLTANLGVRKEIFEEIKFDEEYGLFREDTDFGFRALNKGYATEFADAKVEHDAGKLGPKSFVKDQLRYENEPMFFQKFKDDPKLEDEVRHIGPVLYPLELAITAFLFGPIVLSLLVPEAIFLYLVILPGLSTADFLMRKDQKTLKFCIRDWIKANYYLPAGLIAKRQAIWRGSIKWRSRTI